MAVCGMDKRGQRDILAVEPMLEESEDIYLLLFRGLKERALRTLRLVIAFPQLDARKISSTNVLECLCRENWRRINVVQGILFY